MAVMGIDVGTTGCKAVVYDKNGFVLGQGYREYAILAAHGTFEIDGDMVWENVKQVVEEAAGQTAITAVGISSFGESAVPVDKNGNTLAPAILYTDPRGEQECKPLKQFDSITKLAAHAMYTISKILWQKKHQPQIFEKVFKYLLFEDFILFRLTGNCMISYSEATRTGAFDVEALAFSDPILDFAGLDKNLFSTPVPSGTIVGKINSIPCLAGAVAVTGGQDQICSAVGAGILREGFAALGMGTVECVTPVFAVPIQDQDSVDKGYCCVPYAVAGNFVTYAYSYTGGAMLKWFRDQLVPELAAELPNVYRYFDEKVRDLRTDLLLLPHFAGAATPYMNVNAVGAFVGLRVSTTREDLYRAILEGCCFEMRINIEHLQSIGISIREITATGGGAKSDLWLQMTADVLGIPVTPLANSEAGTAGAALLAGVAVGQFSSLAQGVSKLVSYKEAHQPDPAMRAYYDQKYRRYQKLYTAVQTVMTNE